MSQPVALTTPGYLHRGLDALFDMARSTPLSPECEAFYFIRHGETDGNHKRIFQHAEIPLNARGLAQAEAASAALANARLQRIVASTMTRAWVTAEIIGRPHDLAPIPEVGLRERWFGDLVGTPSHDHDWRDSPPNGETMHEFVTRTQAGIARSLVEAGMTRTALVGHGGILYVLAPSLGLDITTEMLANATPLLFERCNGNAWQVTRIADVGARGDNVS
ncbi:MAG: histidine phosphatase family protein [Hyphomicrobiaceae bacterium]|nr:histidine phosphatase family protein [Hyphomicrobiaceae bacterium]